MIHQLTLKLSVFNSDDKQQICKNVYLIEN